MKAAATNDHCVRLATRIAQSYVTNNSVPAGEVALLLRRVHATVLSLVEPGEQVSFPDVAVKKPTQNEIRRSVTGDGLVSFLDGRTYQTLKRHLAANGLTPNAYRGRYGLPADYPMVASGYAARRSAIARAFGLGIPGAMSRDAAGSDDRQRSK